MIVAMALSPTMIIYTQLYTITLHIHGALRILRKSFILAINKPNDAL